MTTPGTKQPPSRWDLPYEPPRFVRWLARHRVAVRVACVAVDLGLVWILISRVLDGDFSWVAAGVLFSWIFTTIQLGWLHPRAVDQWQARNRGGD